MYLADGTRKGKMCLWMRTLPQERSLPQPKAVLRLHTVLKSLHTRSIRRGIHLA